MALRFSPARGTASLVLNVLTRGPAGPTGPTGDVAIQGTPADNQVAVWKTATKIEGESVFRWDGTKLGVGISSPDGTLHVHTGSAGSITAPTDGDELVVENSAAGGITILTPDASQANLIFGSPSDNNGAQISWKFDDLQMLIKTSQANAFITFHGGTGSEHMRLNSAGDFGIGETTIVGQFHVKQPSTSGAQPVIVLNQTDVDEDYFRFVGTSDTSADRALVDAANFTTPGSIKGWFKIFVQDDQSTDPIVDGDYYIPFYAVPTA